MLTKALDCVGDVSYSNPYIWIHQILCPSFLQKVLQTTTKFQRRIQANNLQTRIFQGRNVQIAIWGTLGLIFIWTVGFFFSNLLQCLPFDVNWTDWGFQEGACFDTNMLFIAQAWSDVFTDGKICAPMEYNRQYSDLCPVLILALPIPSVCVQSVRFV